jgi:hypothetical protein
MRTSAKITLVLATWTFAIAEGRIPALEEDPLFLERNGNGKSPEPMVYVWATSSAGPMYASVRSDIGGWFMYSLSVSAATRKGWLMTVRFPELGIPPPILFASDDPDRQQDSLLGFSILAGKRRRWSHGHLSLAAGINHAQGVRIRSHDTCQALFTGCEQTVEGKERFRDFGPVLQIAALTGWRYFGIGAGIEVLGTRHQAWGWHIQFVGGRVL